jgi:putative NADH-flavin reductase
MKVHVLGATGGTGRLIVSDAAAKGHSVVALVRSMADAELSGAELIEGDARDEMTLRRAIDGCDAVISALGTGIGFRKVSLLAEATCALVSAMTRSGVRRLSYLTGSAWDLRPGMRRLDALLLQRIPEPFGVIASVCQHPLCLGQILERSGRAGVIADLALMMQNLSGRPLALVTA